MNELIEHNCPVEGEIMIEEGKPCNWCEELDDRETKEITDQA